MRISSVYYPVYNRDYSRKNDTSYKTVQMQKSTQMTNTITFKGV